VHIRLDRQCLFAKQVSGPRWSCGSIQTFSFSGGKKKGGAGPRGLAVKGRARDSTSCADAWARQAGKAGEVGGGHGLQNRLALKNRYPPVTVYRR
jgi:hypothetical protein